MRRGGRYAASNEAIDFRASFFAEASRGEMEIERETKDDGRYIIFYTFEDEGSGEPEGIPGEREAR